jgi:glycosyltransferase involved in cell wall biosynthesis
MGQAKRLLHRAAVSAKLRGLSLMRRTYPLRRSVSRRLRLPKPPEGVNLVAYIRADLGLGAAARGMASALQAAGVPFAIVNYDAGIVSPQTHFEWRHKEVKQANYAVTLLCINPDNTTNLRAALPQKLLANRYVIGNWFWELPELPKEWHKDFQLVNEVWVGSHFVKEAVSRAASLPVTRIPPAVEVESGAAVSRSDFQLPDKDYLFLTVADTRSNLERKNPAGVIRAFKRAFDESARVGLVVKLNTAEFQRDEITKLREEISGRKNIYLLDCLLSRAKMIALLQTVDCVISLHRSEGFGLVPAEAMALGKPVIVTAWSGNTDYMTVDNCFPVDFRLVPVGRDSGPYQADQSWADPDLDQAAALMQQVVKDPDSAAAVGLRGRETMRRDFSAAAVGELIRQRLEIISQLR